VADRVQAIGFADQERKRDLFIQTDILLFPTEYPTETFGLVVVEAMAFGVPALVSMARCSGVAATCERSNQGCCEHHKPGN